MDFILPLIQNRTRAKVTKALVILLVEIYNKTPIKTIHTDAIRMKIVRLIAKYNRLTENATNKKFSKSLRLFKLNGTKLFDIVNCKNSPTTCQCENCSKLPQVFKQFLHDQRNQRLEFITEVIYDQPLSISSQDTVCTIGTTKTGWPIQRFVCLLHCVELPLRKLLLELDSLPIELAYGVQAGSTMDGIVYWMARTFWTQTLKISFRRYNQKAKYISNPLQSGVLTLIVGERFYLK
ncbi:hypothetical protein BLOT_013080 [Blomia tropicalis]|nr:hypothetical protein BLOT_013080 [Blomia tropicalis]